MSHSNQGVGMHDEAQIEVTESDYQTTIVGGGTLDLTNSQALHDALKEASLSSEAVTVDLRDAFFIDTQVVQDLARAAVTLNRRDKQLTVLVTEKAHPLRVLKVSGLDTIINIQVE